MNIKRFTMALAVAAALTGTVATPVSAAEVKLGNWKQLADTDSEFCKGNIVDFGSGQEVVMQVNEDGSFATVPFSRNTYSAMAKTNCQHYQWEQVGTAKPLGRKWVHGKSICYNDVFNVRYRCKNRKCKLERTMTTYISHKHHYSKNRCTECKMKKK